MRIEEIRTNDEEPRRSPHKGDPVVEESFSPPADTQHPPFEVSGKLEVRPGDEPLSQEPIIPTKGDTLALGETPEVPFDSSTGGTWSGVMGAKTSGVAPTV